MARPTKAELARRDIHEGALVPGMDEVFVADYYALDPSAPRGNGGLYHQWRVYKTEARAHALCPSSKVYKVTLNWEELP